MHQILPTQQSKFSKFSRPHVLGKTQTKPQKKSQAFDPIDILGSYTSSMVLTILFQIWFLQQFSSKLIQSMNYIGSIREGIIMVIKFFTLPFK